jgi:hypothetical protein
MTPLVDRLKRKVGLAGDKPTEAFLGPDVPVYLTDDEAFGVTIMKAAYGSGPVQAKPKIVFPPRCSGCLEPTERVAENCGGVGSWSWVDGRRQITVRTEPMWWPVPLCERCHSYGFADLIQVEAEFISQSTGWNFWMRFRFPNLAYNHPFLEANSLDSEEAVYARGVLGEEGKRAPRAGTKRRDRGRLEEGLEEWAFVRDGLGFHRYMQLEQRLEEFGKESGADTASRLKAVAEEFSITLEQLRDVERTSQREFPVLEATSGAEAN